MKLLLCTALLLLIPAVSMGYEVVVGGMQEYDNIKIRKSQLTITKMYDHDEGVICYTVTGYSSQSISCVNDLTN